MKKLFAIVSLYIVFIGGVVGAKVTGPRLTVSPHTYDLVVEPGQRVEQTIKIANESEAVMPIKAKVVDFSAVDETGQMIFEPADENPLTDPKYWINIDNPDLMLSPNETAAVNFSLTVPGKAELGGYYTVIIFEPQLPSYYFIEGQPKAIPAVGVIFLISVRDPSLKESAEPFVIAEFGIPTKFRLQRLENALASIFGVFSKAYAQQEEKLVIVENGFLGFSLRVRNNDIYHVKPLGKLEILTMAGKKVGERELARTTILPGLTRRFPVSFEPEIPAKLKERLPTAIINFISHNFLFGKYRARLTLQLENDKGELAIPYTKNSLRQSEIEFWVFPWKLIIILIGILIFLMILILMRKRIGKAIKALLKMPNAKCQMSNENQMPNDKLEMSNKDQNQNDKSS